ncbi:hypothetical protein ADL01_27715 [Streptomyces sp. NRRL WC-3618]|uniref:DUF397 domain-containing protein n=1 Tax=Streptomyces sp. NRRL WC-3618 TaxID=1519490 RepID=UPI0006AF5F51|nr:DUF397 domain-containing protein [Streptomyces sp. NRRL WC-3618]KOV64793.1 hypothetical protein ADL01_27715 [Streptomyces sp. NRRL WC-3618]
MSIAGSRVDGLATWFTSSYSNGAGGECVECALARDGALVRDSKAGGGPVIAVRGQSWEAFVRALRQGNWEG